MNAKGKRVTPRGNVGSVTLKRGEKNPEAQYIY
jgi:hypothetical protein